MPGVGVTNAASSSEVEPTSLPGPVALTPKGGYLYVRVFEAGNLDALRNPGVCCSGRCQGFCCCTPRTPRQLCVSFSCASIEQAVNTTVTVEVNSQLHKAVFNEELLMRSLNFCSADKLRIALLAKSGPVAEVSVPLRAALPRPLTCGVPPVPAASVTAPVLPAECKAWLPRQRLILRPPSSGTPSSPLIGTPSGQPYLELQLLQLVDNSLPRLVDGIHPIMLAIKEEQAQLVRAYLSIDVVETLHAPEQALCLSMAIEQRSHSLLVQLLDQMRPSHQHLLAALQLHAVELVEVLLQAGGAALLHPSPRSSGLRSGGHSSMRRPPRGEASPSSPRSGPAGSRPGGVNLGAAADTPTAPGAPSGQRIPSLTPLAVACSLGDVAMVEALCQWAKQEKVHLDPTAPVSLGDNSPPSGATGLWDWNDHQRDDRGESRARFGDPPMVMAVRGKGNASCKLTLVRTLARYGFSADIRSPVDSWTPLLAAVELGSLELVTGLTKLGARLSADRHLGFTPLHLACQMGHWHLVPFLAEAMQGQHSQVASWGPSPQYVSLNLVDAYGRTALDISLIRYFADPLPCWNDGLGSERQKAVDILREFVHRSQPDDAGVVCGWELLHMLRFLNSLPARKAVGVQFWDADWDGPPLGASTKKKQGLAHGDVEELLQAVRVLVKAGAQTQWLMQDLVKPPSRGLGCAGIGSHGPSGDAKETITALGFRFHRVKSSPQYSPLDPEDFAALSADEATS